MKMMTAPKLEDRPEQPTVGIRTQVPMSAFKKIIPQLLSEVFAWTREQGVAPVGPPFMRFHVINMAGNMDVELGVPVGPGVAGDSRVTAGALPAGRYASLVYTGVRNGIKANGALLDWGAAQGLTWDRHDTAAGDAFAGRYESYLTDPDDESDPKKWETEVAIRVADS
jgi:effector-binding domain-containing protein